ncbi:efflux transporter outer membrane subunit [Massilia arenae]|uniref:Efflux transporter outer membrane subunit n=1 Tax=Massilia arenae TaxID=2603288 RepID=A0A5C7FW30_9BURK|nr:efflux transporter outer membrane subunit [Massilia arenae]TXF99061.1 efflux transporter outer membrane subunit [Massilia arenae]
MLPSLPTPCRLSTRLALVSAMLVLSGCVSMGAQPQLAGLNQDATTNSSRAIGSLATETADWPAQDWWRAYGDSQLDQLVANARDASPTIAGALARVRQAAALEGLAAASLGPQANASVRSARQRYSENGSVPKPLAGSWQWVNDASVNLNYELDFWGKNAAGVTAAAGRVNARRAEAQAARLAVSTAVVQAYLRLDHLYAQRDLAERELRQRSRILELVQQRVSAQLDSKAELKQAEIGVPSARGQIAALDEAIALTRGQIAALGGQGQDAAISIARPQLRLDRPAAAPVDIPAALLGRRPELVALRWQVEAASGEIDVAKAQFYPTVNLSVSGGLASLGFDRLLQGGSRSFAAGPLVTLPLLDGGRLRSNLAARNAEFDVAVETYNAAVVEALRDVTAQLTSLRWLGERVREQDLALGAAEQAYDLAEQRYRAGLGNFVQVLIAETQVVAQRRAQADLDARAYELDVNLVRALGGGYQALAVH